MKSKLLLSINLVIFFLSTLVGCGDDNPETPPLTIKCSIKYVDKNGESLLKQFNTGSDNPIKLDEETMNVKLVLEDISNIEVSTVYLPAYDKIDIKIGDFGNLFSKNVDYQINYIAEIKMPDVIGEDKTDELIISYHIKGYNYELIHVKYNNEIVDIIGSGKSNLDMTIIVDE